MHTDNIPHTYDTPAPYGNDIIKLAIKTFGKEAQTQMLLEEMAELQDAICKHARGRATADHVCEEIADVMIMCRQMAQIYGPNLVDAWTDYKLARLQYRLAQNTEQS